MGNILLSKAGAEAANYIDLKTPSTLIPFRGDFPIVPEWKVEDFWKAITENQFLEDCDEWVQTAVIRGKRIHDIENGFKSYLSDNNIPIEEFTKKSASDKSTLLILFLNANSLTLDSINI